MEALGLASAKRLVILDPAPAEAVTSLTRSARRPASPEQVEAAVFLAGDEAAYVTGSTLFVRQPNEC